MKGKRTNKTKEGSSLLDILNPMMNYLLSIENDIISDSESQLIYTLGVPKNWIMETDLVSATIIQETSLLKIIKIYPTDSSSLKINEFYDYIVNLINKNLLIDTKRIELEEEINKLKNKFEVEQQELMDDLFNSEDKITEQDEQNREEFINQSN
jgi:hypothetical protein